MKTFCFYDKEGKITHAELHPVDVGVAIPEGVELLELDEKTFNEIEGQLECFQVRKGKIKKFKEKVGKGRKLWLN